MNKYLRGLLATLAAVIIAPAIVWAAMNLRQDTDGGASWISSAGNAYKVGRQVLTAQFSDIATASTIHVAADVDGTITGWSSVINNALTTGNCILTLMYNGDHANKSTMTITQSGSAAGDYDVTTGLSLKVTAGGKIAISSDGACDTTTITPVRVFVDPR